MYKSRGPQRINIYVVVLVSLFNFIFLSGIQIELYIFIENDTFFYREI